VKAVTSSGEREERGRRACDPRRGPRPRERPRPADSSTGRSPRGPRARMPRESHENKNVGDGANRKGEAGADEMPRTREEGCGARSAQGADGEQAPLAGSEDGSAEARRQSTDMGRRASRLPMSRQFGRPRPCERLLETPRAGRDASNQCASRITPTPNVRAPRRPALPVPPTCSVPDKPELSPCYGPDRLPVILLSPRVRVFSQTIENKDICSAKAGLNRVRLPCFLLVIGFSPCCKDENGGGRHSRTHANAA